MDNPWVKLKNADNRKRHTLHSICVGVAFFGILCIYNTVFSEVFCPIKKLFGISCFGCGMTRGFISILKFDFVSAFKYNALSIPVFIGIGVYSFCAVLDIFFRKNFVLNIEKQLSKKYMFLVYFILLVFSMVLK